MDPTGIVGSRANPVRAGTKTKDSILDRGFALKLSLVDDGQEFQIGSGHVGEPRLPAAGVPAFVFADQEARSLKPTECAIKIVITERTVDVIEMCDHASAKLRRG